MEIVWEQRGGEFVIWRRCHACDDLTILGVGQTLKDAEVAAVAELETEWAAVLGLKERESL